MVRDWLLVGDGVGAAGWAEWWAPRGTRAFDYFLFGWQVRGGWGVLYVVLGDLGLLADGVDGEGGWLRELVLVLSLCPSRGALAPPHDAELFHAVLLSAEGGPRPLEGGLAAVHNLDHGEVELVDKRGRC